MVERVVSSQTGQTGLVLQQKKDHVAPAQEKATKGPLPNFVKTTDAKNETQTIIAKALVTQDVPSSRAKYFASVLTDPKYQFTRWHITILDVKDSGDSKIVKVRATPQITAGVSATVSGAVDETYEWDGKLLKLLKSEPPPGCSDWVGVFTD